MDSKDHGSSIITRLRLICEEMYNERHNMSAAAGLRSQAENLLPLAEVDEVEVIILREASAIANARGDNALAERLETLRYFIADEQATPAWRGGISQTEAEAIAYEAINTFIVRSAAPIPITHEGLNTIRNAAQQALEHHAPGRWMVDAALPDSDWSRTPAVTVRPAPDTRWHKDGFKPGMTPTRGMGGGPINPDKTGRTLRRVVAASNAAQWEQEATEMMNLVISRPSAHHVQLRDADSGKVFADWWPSRGTTRKDGKMGPTCRTGEDLIAWLRSIG